MIKKIIFVSLLLLILNEQGFSQQDDKPKVSHITQFGVGLDQGYLLKHTPSLKAIDQAYPSGLFVDWGKLLLSENAWNFCNCFPKLGVNLSYWNFDNTDVLGHGVIAMAYAEPYFRTHKRLSYFFSMGIGGAYLTNPFDFNTNPLNESYSTDLSFALMVGTGVSYRIDNNLNLRFAFKYNHTSNGGVKTPNKGLNFPSLSIGVFKSIDDLVFPDFERVISREAPAQKKRWSVTHFSGWSNASVGDKDKFYVFGFEGKYSRWIGRRSALSGGVEVIFDYSRREQIELEGLSNTFVQSSALIGHEFWLGRVTFSQQLGVYVVNDYRINDDVYQRYALTYDVSKHFFAGFSLKAHRHVADFFDLRVGYRF